jgi:ABC-type phosphate/phosphonate transport system permease subunit
MEHRGAQEANGMRLAAPIRRPTMRILPRLGVIQLSIIFLVVLMGASWFSVLGLDRRQSHPFFSGETLSRAGSFANDLLGVGSSNTPAYAQAEEWRHSARLAYDTLAMSVLAIGLAAAGAFVTFMFGARNVMLGELAPNTSWVWRATYLVVRGFFTLSRAIPELVWAMLIIFVLSPGILPGAVALALHNWGILGKLSSEVVEGLDPGPARALQSAGANRLQVLIYGVLPQALPRFLTYLFYRWEVIIRTTIVVGFVASGGLGTEFRLSMSLFHYTTVTLLLMWYLILVVSVDLLSAGMSRLAK